MWTLDGDESIRKRPVDRVLDPLAAMGARIEARDGRLAPMTVHGGELQGAEHKLPMASAQVKSCLLIAGMLADGETSIIEPARSRDHTERMLKHARVPFEKAGNRVTVRQMDELELDAIVVPGDPSSAAFLVAAACVVPGSRLLVSGVGLNWTRTGFFRIAQRMGAVIVGEMEEPPEGDAIPDHEPVGELDVRAAALEATVVEGDEVPLAIDELPLVALLGACAEGETIVRGAGELRVKETDRIAGVVDGLTAIGVDIEATEDGFAVRGGPIKGGTLEARGDHRLAMLGAIAGLASQEGVEVQGMEAAAISYPAFEDDLRGLLDG
jgi:3-phosphoshikimate 1-carboxyvinyltransferase